jgi:hypothetical protein
MPAQASSAATIAVRRASRPDRFSAIRRFMATPAPKKPLNRLSSSRSRCQRPVPRPIRSRNCRHAALKPRPLISRSSAACSRLFEYSSATKHSATAMIRSRSQGDKQHGSANHQRVTECRGDCLGEQIHEVATPSKTVRMATSRVTATAIATSTVPGVSFFMRFFTGCVVV